MNPFLIVFSLLLFTAIIVHKRVRFQTLLIPVIGFLIPIFLFFTYSFWIGELSLFTDKFIFYIEIAHPFWMLGFLVLTTITFSLFGFLIGIWADGFEKLQLIPLLVITPMVFLGGAFYSIDMLPSAWQKVTMFNPVVYLISGFRWSFYEISDVRVGVSLAMIMLFMGICLALIAWIFKTGYRLKQ